MNESALNQLTVSQLADFARSSTLFLAATHCRTAKLELYYIEGQFIELSYRLKKLSQQPADWQLYSANHFPNTSANTKYLHIYLRQIQLPISL
ncbi:hypothetical protein GCM10028805_18540 [Spirosoma harenae]